MRLVTVSVAHADHDTVDLDLSENTSFITEIALPMGAMGAGQYTTKWISLGEDGHPMNGTFMFPVL